MNPITTIFSTVSNNFINPVYSGICLVLGGVAAIAFLVMLVRGIFDARGEHRSRWMFGIGVLAAILLLAAFLPDIVNWVLSLSGNSAITGVGA